VLAPPLLGHDARFPVRNNWRPSRDELLAFIEAQLPASERTRLALVGHSLGGYLALLAACRKPEWVGSVVLLDSPLLGGWRSGTVGLAKAIGLMGRLSPGRVSAQRRVHWDSAQSARAHFEAKKVFARWAPGVLADYLAAGLTTAPGGGVELSFDREVETAFYNTLPHHWGVLLRRHRPRCRVHFVAGTRSREVQQAGLATTERWVRATQGRLAWIEGSHLFPMEKPREAAQAVLRAVNA
jgi:pimeloyl-ACP methyl ester carboxylesterase